MSSARARHHRSRPMVQIGASPRVDVRHQIEHAVALQHALARSEAIGLRSHLARLRYEYALALLGRGEAGDGAAAGVVTVGAGRACGPGLRLPHPTRATHSTATRTRFIVAV